MAIQLSNDVASDLIESAAAEEEELMNLEEELQQMAENLLQHRTTLRDQLTSTQSSVLISQRPILQTRLIDEGPEFEIRMLPGSDPEAAISQDSMRALSMTEAEKLRVLKQKISSNASMTFLVLKRMQECMARIDKLELPSEIIHPAFKRKLAS